MPPKAVGGHYAAIYELAALLTPNGWLWVGGRLPTQLSFSKLPLLKKWHVYLSIILLVAIITEN